MELLCFFMNFGWVMRFDALSNGIADFSLVFIMLAARRKSIMSEFTSVQKCVLFLVFFYNSGNDAASSNLKLVYFHWFYSNYASGTTRSYNAPANNAKYSVSKKLNIPYVFEQIRCFQPITMSQIVKNQLVFITFLKFIMIYNIEND